MAATRYVKATGGTTGAFTSKSTPAKSIALAVKAASPGDTIEIMDAATYAGAELVIDKAITITSSYLVGHPTIDPTAAKFVETVLPTIASDGDHRVMRIQGTPATRASFGPVVVSGVRISTGVAVHAPQDPGIGCGGGIVVVDADQVTIDRCFFRGNRTRASAVLPWPEADRVALRQAILDLLGDIFSTTVETALNALIGAANLALGYLRPGTVIAPIDRTVILAEVGREFDGKIGAGRPNHAITGQAFGGGLATVWASPTVSRCAFEANTANGRGGGIAVTGYGWPTISGCAVRKNTTLAGGRCDGGGIGCEVAVPSKLGRDLFETGMVRFLVGKLAAARAVIGSPLSSISLSDVIDAALATVSPSTSHPVFRGVRTLILDAVTRNWGHLTDHLLYYFVTSALSLAAGDAWERTELDAARKSAIRITETTISGNHGFDDGGGLYASVLSRLTLSGVTVADNIAENMGGGIRLTMGSGTTMSGCTVTGNRAGAGSTGGAGATGPLDKGGGLAARNVDLAITTSTFGSAGVGATVPGTASNLTGDAPGGGLAFEASSEGAMSGIPDLWSSILVEAFAVRSVAVTIGPGCTIGANGAGFGPGRGALPRALHAKGGGMFVVRGDFPDAPKLTVSVAAVRTTISGNRASTVNYLSSAQKGLRVAASNEVSLQDVTTGKEYTESNWGPLIDSAGTLAF